MLFSVRDLGYPTPELQNTGEGRGKHYIVLGIRLEGDISLHNEYCICTKVST